MREHRETFGPEWVRLYSGDLSAGALGTAITWATDTVRTVPPDLGELDWSNLAQKTQTVYEALLAMPTGRLARRSGVMGMGAPTRSKAHAPAERGRE
jgi:hypothetical protein